MSNNHNFYHDLKAVSGFSNIFDPLMRRAAPDDWHAVIADVKNSTQAISEGRYKDVNMAGAACIVSVLNAIENEEVPFVFGGDGASFLIPPHLMCAVCAALEETRTIAQQALGIDLRLGAVPLHNIYNLGKILDVSRYALPGRMEIAMFHGGGLSAAESMVKEGQNTEKYGLDKWLLGHTPKQPDLNGLECRWNPITARREKIVTLIVLTRKTEQIYQGVFEQIGKIFGAETEYRPVAAENISLTLKPENLKGEYALNTAGSSFFHCLAYGLKMVFENLCANFLFAFNISAAGLEGRKYKNDVALNTDFQKFDDTLRLVLDATDQQIKELQAYLKEGQTRGDLFYGVSISDSAMMTCLIFERTERHLHFIDGAAGGYTMAAQMMKSQIETAGSIETAA